MRHMVPIVVVVGTLLAVPVRVSAQRTTDVSEQDPALGTWQLNVAKSVYNTLQRPVSQTRTFEKHPLGVKATMKTVYPDGRSTTVESVYDYDNQEHQATGLEEGDVIRVKRIDAFTVEARLSSAGRETGVFRREISKDGKQMTVTLGV